MAFTLPFEIEISALDEQLASLPDGDSSRALVRGALDARERAVYPNLGAYETFLLSGNPLRPKTLDYVRHIFSDVQLYENPEIRGDHMMIAGEGKIELGGQTTHVVIIGQQTGPSSNRDDLLRLSASEYARWNQGMGYPDGYRKAIYAMNIAEQRGWPVVVFVDTPGADPSEYSEEEGQAFAINDVIHKTTSLRTPSLSYIISLGASGGAIAITPTSRTIMNQFATYMVISPGGCASILFRNRSPESIRKAAEGLCLTSQDALRQCTVDEVIEEGTHPGHRYPEELLAKGKEAVTRHLSELIGVGGIEAEQARRSKFYAMGRWGKCADKRRADSMAKLARKQRLDFETVKSAVMAYIGEQAQWIAKWNGKVSAQEITNARLLVARAAYATQKGNATYISETIGCDAHALSKTQWSELFDHILERRYGADIDTPILKTHSDLPPYRRLHPVDWIRLLTDTSSFREFVETIAYISIDQLRFPQYEATLARGITSTRLNSGVITGSAAIGGHPVVLAINNFGLVGSSLCDEIGEKFRHAACQACRTQTPLISIAMGGGARMQEGTPSMHRNIPKAQHALNELEEAGIAHISVICDPTLGGTAISYGLRGDYMIVVSGSANIGFSGKRVVEQFQQRKVAPDFQHETWLLHRGFVDECVETDGLASRLTELLAHLGEHGSLARLRTRLLRNWEPTRTTQVDAPPPRPHVITTSSKSCRHAPHTKKTDPNPPVSERKEHMER